MTGTGSTGTKKSKGSSSKRDKKKKFPKKSEPDMTFKELDVTLETVESVVMLLQSSEDLLVLQAIWSLAKFGSGSIVNLEVLLSIGLLDKIVPLVTSSDKRTRQFTLKLISDFCKLEEIRNQMYKIPETIDQIFSYYAKETDEFLLEYTSKILAQLLSHVVTLRRICWIPRLFELLYQKVGVPDPDIRFNTAQIIVHILRDSVSRAEFLTSPTFTFQPYLNFLHSFYPKIQRMGLCIMNLLTSRPQETTLHERFRQCGAIEQLFEILDEITWSDLHHVALCIIANVARIDAGVLYLESIGGLAAILTFIDRICMPDMISCGLAIFTQLSQSELGRELLVKHNVESVFSNHLSYKDNDVVETSCYGLAFLGENRDAIKNIALLYAIKPLNDIFRHELMPWRTRYAAAFSMYMLAKRGRGICHQIADIRIQDLFYKMMNNDTTPAKVLITLLKCLEAMASHERVREQILEFETIASLLGLVRGVDQRGPDALSKADMESFVPVKIEAIHTLCAFLKDSYCRDYFLDCDGVNTIHACLTHKSEALRQTASLFTQLAASDRTLGEAFILAGIIPTLLNDTKMLRCSPSWDNTLKKIFRFNLSMKFAYTGRLDVNDITREAFYATLRPVEHFPLLDAFLEENMSLEKPIFVCNFKPFTPLSSKTRTVMKVVEKTASQASITSQDVILSQASLTCREQRHIPDLRFRPLSLSLPPPITFDRNENNPTMNSRYIRVETPLPLPAEFLAQREDRRQQSRNTFFLPPPLPRTSRPIPKDLCPPRLMIRRTSPPPPPPPPPPESPPETPPETPPESPPESPPPSPPELTIDPKKLRRSSLDKERRNSKDKERRNSKGKAQSTRGSKQPRRPSTSDVNNSSPRGTKYGSKSSRNSSMSKAGRSSSSSDRSRTRQQKSRKRDLLIKRTLSSERGVQKSWKSGKKGIDNRLRKPLDRSFKLVKRVLSFHALNAGLQVYLDKLTNDLKEDNRFYKLLASSFKVKGVAFHANIIARFVVKQMNGVDPYQPCDTHVHELHINELKRRLQANVIPLSFVKVGSYFERALLFKVLADRVSFPCALVRGKYGRAWVEVIVPDSEMETSTGTMPSCTPHRTNHIVDLVVNVGELIPLGSPQAIHYCNIPR